MPFHKITHNEKLRFATVHNYGCTFHCPFCSYKLRSGADGTPGLAYPKPDRFLNIDEIKTKLRGLSIKKVYVMGGEPTVARETPELLRFAKEELGVETRLGHTNGSGLPLPFLDGANVGFKAWDEALHLSITGRSKSLIYGNFETAFKAGIDLRANIVFVPGLVDRDQVEALAAWLGALSRSIPFHIMGYIPVPGQAWRRPSEDETLAAVAACRRHLDKVEMSRLSPEDALGLKENDERFATQRVA